MRSRSFAFQGRNFRYFVHYYNAMEGSDRAVEIPLARAFLERFQQASGIEVGNVLPHYLRVRHPIIDKYEKAPGVLNQDVLEFEPPAALDFIVSISTLEHVGWDELPRDPAKVEFAIERLRRMLKPSGRMFVTCPLGHNSHLDSLVLGEKTDAVEEGFLQHAGSGSWHQIRRADVTALASQARRDPARILWIAELSPMTSLGRDEDRRSHGDEAQAKQVLQARRSAKAS
ncbi:MAG TPA: class I SAM-dependent methyltransferase [Gemmatimonadaceae bacterium]|nr:class I SAM-dependent methyltransferase [Gemmatimonadaceae bacterium]